MFTHKSSPSAGIANQRPLISSSFRPSTVHPRSPSIITGTTHNRLPFSPSNSPCSLRLTVTATQLQVLLTSPLRESTVPETFNFVRNNLCPASIDDYDDSELNKDLEMILVIVVDRVADP
ncbi:hypothetical protein RYX36_010815 [Vicia faba]